MNISESELLEALAAYELAPTGGGMRVVEIAKVTGLSPLKVRTLLAEALARGVVVRSTRVIERLDGRCMPVGTYAVRKL